MDYTDATSQITKVEQQNQNLAQQLQTFAQKLNSQAPDPTTGKEWVLDLKQIAINVQTQNQALMMMVNQMAEHIHNLEQQLDTHPNPTMQPRGWGTVSTTWRGILGKRDQRPGTGCRIRCRQRVGWRHFQRLLRRL